MVAAVDRVRFPLSYAPGIVAGASASAGLAMVAAVIVFAFPLAIWLRYARQVNDSGGLYSFVEAAVGRPVALVQAGLWIVSYLLYLLYTTAQIVYSPPAGFETRVMERIGLATPGPAPVSWISRARHFGWKLSGRTGQGQVSRARRMLAVAAVALAVVVSGLGGWGLHAAATSPPASSLSSAALLSASHQTVGKIFVYNGSSRWMYMSVNMYPGNGSVICQLVGTNGHVTTVGSFRLVDGYGYWGSPAPANLGPLAGARLISTNGTVVATASFSAA